jgi:aminopeptidase N
MFESFLGPGKFAKGTHLHLERYRSGNATADDFFRSLGDAAGDPKIVPAMRTFTDQTGVPLITVTSNGQTVTLSQTRYRPLGVAEQPAQMWKVPVCLAAGSRHSCQLLEMKSATMPAPVGSGALMPNAGGAGYYRFRLDAAGWDRLIGRAGTLPEKEALALADSLWADFAAGTGSFDRVISAARALSTRSERLSATDLASRLRSLANSALTEEQSAQYRKLMRSIYAPRLSALGFDPRAGAYSAEPPAKQALRQALLPAVALEARDPDVRKTLETAALACLSGDTKAIDPAFRAVAFGVAVQNLGAPFMTKLRDAMVESSDPLFRSHATQALAAADTPQLTEETVRLALAPGVQSVETMQMVLGTAEHPGSRDTLVRLLDQNFKQVVESFPGFARPFVIHMFDGYCSIDEIAKVDAFVKPKLQIIGGGELQLAQAKERIGQCAALKNAKGGEISAALAKSSS